MPNSNHGYINPYEHERDEGPPPAKDREGRTIVPTQADLDRQLKDLRVVLDENTRRRLLERC
jgi:hypothetical protein